MQSKYARTRRRVSLSHTENLCLCVLCIRGGRRRQRSQDHRIPYKIYLHTSHRARDMFVYYIYQQQNRSHVLLSKLNWFRVPRMTRFLHRFSLCVVAVVGHSRPPLPSCAQTLYFVLSFSRCLCLLHIHTHFMAPCKPIVPCSFPFIHFASFPSFPSIFPRISFSLPLTHSAIRSRSVRAEQFVYIVDNRLFFSSLLVLSRSRSIPPTFFSYMTSI